MQRAWTSGQAITLHVAALVVVPGCLALAGWQATRAMSGNTLSWAYTFEWPIFAGYAAFMWWRLLHDHDASERLVDASGSPSETSRQSDVAASPDEGSSSLVTADAYEEDEELAAYNQYLAALNASGKRKQW